MGSKNRISKNIIPIMQSYRKPDQFWVEPFVGGANSIDKVPDPRIGSDSNPNTISALISIRDHLEELPKSNQEFTEEDYNLLKQSSVYKHHGYAGYAFSYGGKWLGGWRRDSANKRDYISESYKNAVKQSPNLQGLVLINSDYESLDIPPQSLMYCDPPYQNTTNYKSTSKFDHNGFWQWCLTKSNEGHTVFISEYHCPLPVKNYKTMWEKQITSSLTKDTGSKIATEKLFLIVQT